MVALIRGLQNMVSAPKGGVVTMGNFDGVHKGHQTLLKKTIDKAREWGVPSLVITFEPQPFEFFGRGMRAPRLTRFREKICLLAETGIDAIFVIRFNQHFANLTAEAFVEQILHEGLQARHVIVGDDFKFGYGRRGDFHFLETAGKRPGFSVEETETVMLDGKRISSTEVRNALAHADHARVRQLLGRNFSMQGRIVHGDKRGREMGFPTANIDLHEAKVPVHGVYIVRMHGVAEKGLPGVANVGTRPTIGGTRRLLEVHLFDFAKNLYGQHVRVEFCEKIRDEKYFPSLDLLIEEMHRDAMSARRYFEKRGEL